MESANQHDIIFYDGECGLCQGFVLRLLHRDQRRAFRFAPLQGETFLRAIAPQLRSRLPDSLVVVTSSGELLVRSAAAIHVLRRLKGFKLAAMLVWLVPRPLRDALYHAMARHRRDRFAQPNVLCRAVPENLRERFLP